MPGRNPKLYPWECIHDPKLCSFISIWTIYLLIGLENVTQWTFWWYLDPRKKETEKNTISLLNPTDLYLSTQKIKSKPSLYKTLHFFQTTLHTCQGFTRNLIYKAASFYSWKMYVIWRRWISLFMLTFCSVVQKCYTKDFLKLWSYTSNYVRSCRLCWSSICRYGNGMVSINDMRCECYTATCVVLKIFRKQEIRLGI